MPPRASALTLNPEPIVLKVDVVDMVYARADAKGVGRSGAPAERLPGDRGWNARLAYRKGGVCVRFVSIVPPTPVPSRRPEVHLNRCAVLF